ncbi:MAG: ABC transporter substrate-binding protein, partial [Treponema sp.]|nr:ABC transporter substrate-binding protein [Treponema sp.]
MLKQKLILVIIIIAGIIVTSVLSACKPSEKGKVEITLVNNKIEIDAALKSYAIEYERQTGVRVIIRSFGADIPYAQNITAMFNSGFEPEIFVIEGKSKYEEIKQSGRVMDLSHEPWVKDTDVAFIDPENGKVTGFPVDIEGWGLGYNKELLARAGIDPLTLVNFAAIKGAFEKINSMKNELGIDAVISMVAGPGMTWVTGLHGVNAYLTLGLPYNNSTRYIDMMLNRQVDNDRLMKFAEYYNLLFNHSIRDTLLSGSYEQQLEDYALGKTVFIHQGNWTDPTFIEMGVTFEMGYVPHAFLDDTTNGIFVMVPSWYIVNPKAKNTEEARKFLTAMATTKEGHNYMVNYAGM